MGLNVTFVLRFNSEPQKLQLVQMYSTVILSPSHGGHVKPTCRWSNMFHFKEIKQHFDLSYESACVYKLNLELLQSFPCVGI